MRQFLTLYDQSILGTLLKTEYALDTKQPETFFGEIILRLCKAKKSTGRELTDVSDRLSRVRPVKEPNALGALLTRHGSKIAFMQRSQPIKNPNTYPGRLNYTQNVSANFMQSNTSLYSI